MSEVDPARHCKLSFEGVGGGAGSAKGFSDVDLTDEAGGTRLNYSIAASVGGKLGQIGGRLIDSSAKKMADEFFAALQQQLGGESIAHDTPGAGGNCQPAIFKRGPRAGIQTRHALSAGMARGAPCAGAI